jgi:phosphohistidine swiveling domain-containing protein
VGRIGYLDDAQLATLIGVSNVVDLPVGLPADPTSLVNFATADASYAPLYTTGDGGAVTQATSKSTAVTLNKATGQITTHNGLLAAAAVVEFTVGNSTVAATDTITLNLASGAVSGTTYRYWVSAVAANSFKVCIENRSAGGLSEALVFNFTLAKGVAS